MTTMNSIVDDSTELYRLFAELEERTKDMSEFDKAEEYAVLADWLGETQGAFERKVDGYVAVIREMKANAQTAKDEAKRLTERAKSFENQADSLKEMLGFAMNRIGMDKCKTAFNTVSFAKTPAPLTINENLLPQDYLRITVAPDKRSISNAIKQGETIPGVEVGEAGKSLRIR